MDATDITFRIAIEPLPSGECPADLNALIRHIEEKMRLVGSLPPALTGFSTGPSDPGPDARERPWLKIDGSTGTFIGVFHWNSSFGMWERSGAVGERITKQRTEATVAADRAKSGLDGPWKMADGTFPGVPNLMPTEANGLKTQFFAGTGPEWDTYTVVKTGAP